MLVGYCRRHGYWASALNFGRRNFLSQGAECLMEDSQNCA